MRDLETIRLALTAAETGHLVFGTLHPVQRLKPLTALLMCFRRRETAGSFNAVGIPSVP